MNDIASVSLHRPTAAIAAELGASLAKFGFAVVRDHGIDAALIARADELARCFFALPEEVKRAYHQPGGGGARGYTPWGMERAKGAAVHDLKEFWHVGRSLPAGHRYEPMMPPNLWPDEIEGFRETMEALFSAFESAGSRLLEAIALHLRLRHDFFYDLVAEGNSVMRLLHYPPLAEEDGTHAPAEGAVRAAPHGDINAITLLLGAQEAGLELLTNKGEWLAVAPPEGALVVNIGDMLERLTNGTLRSTLHRVINPLGEAARRSRYSMPFFLHFRPDFLIDPLPQCREGGWAEVPAPITAHDFLQQRLREINLAR